MDAVRLELDESALIQATENGDLAEVATMLAAGAELGVAVDSTTSDGTTALLQAASWTAYADVLSPPVWHAAAMVEMLLATGEANVIHTNTDGQSVLMLAAMNRDVVRVNVLLAYGADINHSSRDASTALTWACLFQDEDLVACLLAAGADAGLVDRDGDSAFLIAVKCGESSIVEMLLARGADVNQTNSAGSNALMLAASHRHDHVTQLLPRSGVDVELLNNAEESALDAAVDGDTCICTEKRTGRAFLFWGFDTNNY